MRPNRNHICHFAAIDAIIFAIFERWCDSPFRDFSRPFAMAAYAIVRDLAMVWSRLGLQLIERSSIDSGRSRSLVKVGSNIFKTHLIEAEAGDIRRITHNLAAA
jgi:hypothetical protein